MNCDIFYAQQMILLVFIIIFMYGMNNIYETYLKTFFIFLHLVFISTVKTSNRSKEGYMYT
jgi:hypothetical protein